MAMKCLISAVGDPFSLPRVGRSFRLSAAALEEFLSIN